MNSKKLNLKFIGEQLKIRYANIIRGYQEFSPGGIPFGPEVHHDDEHRICIVLRYHREDNPDDVINLLYYPAQHKTMYVHGKIIVTPFTRIKQQTYLGKYIRVKVSEENDCIIFTQELRSTYEMSVLPSGFDDAEERLNVRFLLSSDEELVKQSWVEDKKIEAIVWDKMSVGYLYRFHDSKKSRANLACFKFLRPREYFRWP